MKGRLKKRIVVDADVARAAGGRDRPNEGSVRCSAALDALLRVCHRVVMSVELLEEWKGHRSKHAQHWLNQMFGRKKVVKVNAEPDADLDEAIDSLEEPDRETARKDLHLVAMALRMDGIILSADDKARAAFGRLCGPPSLHALMWANPANLSDDVVGWLEQGAPEDRQRLVIDREAPPE